MFCDFSNEKLKIQEHILFPGSKAKVLAAPLENDADLMKIPMDLICSKYPDLLRNRDYKIIFALDTRFRTPGYTFLRILHFNEYLPITDFIHECLAELSPGQLYLSSDIWNNDIKLM